MCRATLFYSAAFYRAAHDWGQPSARRAVPHAVDYPVDRMITVVTGRITVTASYSSDRAQIGRMLASAALPMPARGSDGGATPPGMTRLRPAGIRAAVPQALPAAATSYTRPGFDACTAPSAAQMQAGGSARRTGRSASTSAARTGPAPSPT
jgi:hypothetical protein